MIYSSPWYRCRQTAQSFRDLNPNAIYYEDPRLREQEWGNFQEENLSEKIKKDRESFGTFFYRISDGESGADVFDRVSTFLETLYRDFQKPDYPANTVIFSHGRTIRVFLMRWFHWTVEEIDSLKNPPNCAIIEMRLKDDDKYELITKMAKRQSKTTT